MKIILVSTQAHLRRIGMEFRKRLIGNKFELIYEYPNNSILSFENVIKNADTRILAINEINKIIRFIDIGIIDDEKI